MRVHELSSHSSKNFIVSIFNQWQLSCIEYHTYLEQAWKLDHYLLSPKPTLSLTSHLGQNVGSGEGWVGRFSETYNDLNFQYMYLSGWSLCFFFFLFYCSWTVKRLSKNSRWKIWQCWKKKATTCGTKRELETILGSLYISGKLPTYPSPKPTLTLTSHLGKNVCLGEG